MIFELLLLSLAINIIMFIPAFILKTDKLTDISYSLSFIILTLIIFLTNINFTNMILFLLITLWGVRLGTYLLIRINKIKKDKRFDGMREKFFNFLGFWLLQGFTVWVVLIPTLLVLTKQVTFSYLSLIGLVIFIKGLLIESFADYQKFTNYKKDKWIDIGLWKYSRHPNYFGEILVWIGIYLYTLPYLIGYEKLIGLISPIFITILLLFVSGVPKLEKVNNKKFGKLKEYQEYKKRTGLLIPKWTGKS